MTAMTITAITPTPGALASQALFEAMTSTSPKVDLRTPADVRAQAGAEGWR
jgi:hypothetical protein